VDKRASAAPDTNNKLLESIVAGLLSVQVSSPGTAQLTHFSLGAEDKHCVQATASLTVPATGACVYKLFAELGVANVLRLVCAVLADYKVLFFSRSCTRLYEACRALEALLFPLKYTGVFVPVLPCHGAFLEFPAAPTPYIIGVHAAYRRLIEDMHGESLLECVKVDLDGAALTMPQCVDDLIGGVRNCGNSIGGSSSSMIHHQAASHHLTVIGSSCTTSSGVTSISSSSASSFNGGVHHLPDGTLPRMTAPSNGYYSGGASFATAAAVEQEMCGGSFGLPHHLYETTLNLLFALLKPDVLRADELTEFSSQLTSVSSTIGPTPVAGQQQQQIDEFATTTASNLNINDLSTTSQPLQQRKTATSPTAATPTAAATSGMSSSEVDAIWKDKMLRAVFVRLFAQLFAGYRYCLLVVRINPRPVIGFNRSAFLAEHRLLGTASAVTTNGESNEFMSRLLDSMSFQRFIEERGPSYRHCDVFDEVYASVQSQLIAECEQHVAEAHAASHAPTNTGSLVFTHLKQIADKLFKYEFPHTNLTTASTSLVKSSQFSSSQHTLKKSKQNTSSSHQPVVAAATCQSMCGVNCGATSCTSGACVTRNMIGVTPCRSVSKIHMPTPDAHRRLHAERFPLLDEVEIERLIQERQQNHRHAAESAVMVSEQQQQPRNPLCRPHLVPYGPPVETVHHMTAINRQLCSNLNYADLNAVLASQYGHSNGPRKGNKQEKLRPLQQQQRNQKQPPTVVIYNENRYALKIKKLFFFIKSKKNTRLFFL
jgi:hypothetical protein